LSTLAPIVLFAYRRPDHLRNTLESLKQCEGFSDSPVIVYCDGPRNSEENASVEATREVARALLGDQAEYHFSQVNQGLSRSVISGVSATLQRYDRIIVVEDDLQLAPTFLRFMNDALARYAGEGQVFQVSAYMFEPAGAATPERSAVFLPFPGSWGWATWRRAWGHFDPAATGWETLLSDRKLRRRFNLDGCYDYATMLVRQMTGQRDSWAVRWYWTIFQHGGLVLYPPASLVINAGMDGSGTHGRGRLRKFSAARTISSVADAVDWPGSVRLDAQEYDKVKRALWMRNGGWVAYCMDRVRWLVTLIRSKRGNSGHHQ
jgi:hypothetical protein